MQFSAIFLVFSCVLAIARAQTTTCEQSYCSGSGNCVSNTATGDRTCNCFYGYMGSRCQLEDPCLFRQPCVHGTCYPFLLANPERADYYCQCFQGFYGNDCELSTSTSACSSRPCLNNGVCSNSPNDNGYSCTCTDQYTGSNCGTYIDLCSNNKCENGAICKPDIAKNNYTCECKVGFFGQFCAEEINECIIAGPNGTITSPCVNGDCYDLIENFYCSCKPTWTGTKCDIKINPCTSNPCSNGQVCEVTANGGYTCVCPPGTFGSATCKPNPCISNPCTRPGSKCLPVEYTVVPGCDCAIGLGYICVCNYNNASLSYGGVDC